MDHSFKSGDINNVYAAECLSVLLDENEQLLDQVVTADVVAQFGLLLREQVACHAGGSLLLAMIVWMIMGGCVCSRVLVGW